MIIFEIDTDKKETLSINLLDNFLICNLNWKFIRFPDKTIAIDGLFEMYNKNGKKSGNHIWVQVKTGKSYLNSKNKNTDIVVIDLKKPDVVKAWKNIWEKVPGSMILVYVDFIDADNSKPVFYWVDLKNPNSYSQTNSSQLIIPSNQRLDNDFLQGCKTLNDFKDYNDYKQDLPVIEMAKDSFHFFSLSNPIKQDARKFYQRWSEKKPVNPAFGNVEVNRVGWLHMTRTTRRKERIIQSFQLLPVAEKIINEVTHFRQIGGKFKARYYKESNSIKLKQYFYLRAKVSFNHRHESVVYVILRKITEVFNDESKEKNERVWFYTVYEGERGKKKATNNTQSITKESNDAPRKIISG